MEDTEIICPRLVAEPVADPLRGGFDRALEMMLQGSPLPASDLLQECYAATGECLALNLMGSIELSLERYEIARACIERGLHVLLEKPPAVTLSEVDELSCLAEAKGVTLFATWHARHNPAVRAAAQALAGKRIADMRIVWHEDVHKWHPCQRWIWEPGGFGVFDPGINAFSIATAIFPGALFVRSAELSFPANAHTPIAADIVFAGDDWRRKEDEEWTMEFTTADGRSIRLSDGGARLSIDGLDQQASGPGEYPDIYREFVDLIDQRRSSVDLRPLRIVADCLLASRRRVVEPVTM
jgi:predicted dehydrogenase